MTYTLTAADYTYLDRTEALFNATAAFIASHRDHPGTDRHTFGKRPGIPGTLKELNERVIYLTGLGQYEIAARLIEKKVRKAYRVEGTP